MAGSASGSDFFDRYARAERAGLPKYARLRDALLAAIADGLWAPGARLPDEQTLARTTPYSLGTVQKALRELAGAGVVTRQQGRGTFVAQRSVRDSMDTPLHLRFEDEAGVDLRVYPHIVCREPAAPRGPWPAALADLRDCLRIDRVHSVADEFRVFTSFFVDARSHPVFASWPLRRLHARNFKHVLAENYHARVARLEQRLRALSLPGRVTAELGLRRNAPGLWLGLTAYAAGGRVLYYQEAYIPQTYRPLCLPEGVLP
jgi:DNA-binding GntR family transcriptional regulator